MMGSHPISELIPAMSDQDYARLREDIQAHGLLQPITLYEGQILDGRHRHRVCSELGITPRFTEFSGDSQTAAQFVFSQNLARRQLSKGQLALAGVKLKAFYSERARERQKVLGRHHGALLPVNLPEGVGDARDEAARLVGVSGRTVDHAERVMNEAHPDVVAKVESGEMSLNEAISLLALPKDSQKRLAAIANKPQRRAKLSKNLHISQGRKRGAAARATPRAKPPGTPLVCAFLTRLELLTDLIGEAQLTAEQFAQRFNDEFDWNEPLLVKRLEYVTKGMEAIRKIRTCKSPALALVK
jgi:hypothetical protein